MSAPLARTAQVRTQLTHTWQTRGLVACALWPLSLLYGVLSKLHKSFYTLGLMATVRVPVPVVVVGNVVAGGAGKTPLVIALVRHWQQQGLAVGVVSRGYGRQAKYCVEVLESTPISESGDEPALILRARHAPVFVANKRSDAILALLAKYPATQLIVCDDGLQHHGLARDVEIAVFDDRGIGNGWLLPAGPLRERRGPLQQHGRVVLHTGRSPAFAGYRSSRRLADHAVASDGQKVPLEGLKNQSLVALAGIAQPSAFFDMLKLRGFSLAQTISLPDHFDFAGYTLPIPPGTTVLCTEKDAVKLFKRPAGPEHDDQQILAVPLEFSPEPAFLTHLDALLAPLLMRSSGLPSRQGHKNGH